MSLPGGPITNRVRCRLAFACGRAFLFGILTLLAIAAVFAGIAVLGSEDGLEKFAIILMVIGGTALVYGLLALAAAIGIVFLSGRHVLDHPIAFALLGASMGPMMIILSDIPPAPATLGAAFMTLPGVFVSFVVLAGSFHRLRKQVLSNQSQ